MFKNNKSIEDTYATKSIIQNIVGQAQIKHTKISYEEIYDDRFFHSYFL